MSRRNMWLGVVLLVQILLVALVYWPGGAAGPAAKLLPGFNADAVSGIEISDNNDNRVELVKEATVWQVRLKDKSLYPADGNKVEKLLSKIGAITTDRMVSSAAAARRRLEVAEDRFNRRLVIRKGGEEEIEIFLGTSPGFRKVHVRRGDSDAIFLARDLATWEVAAGQGSWWQRRYLDYDPAGALSVSLKNSHGGFTVSRADTGSPWQAEGGRELDREKVASLLDDLCRLTITDLVVDKSFTPGGDPVATLTIEGKDGKKTLSVWKPEKKDGDYTVKLKSSSHYARAANYALDRLLSADPAELDSRKEEEKKS